MRHLGTLIAAAVIGPSVWILLAFGQDRSADAFAQAERTGTLHASAFVRPFEYLAVAGLMLGLIATLRFSPLGAVVTGLGYTLSYAALLVAPQGMMDLLHHRVSIAGRHADLAIPVRTGTTLVLGALLLVAILSFGRWRGRGRPEDEPFDEVIDRDRPVGADGLDLDPPPRRRLVPDPVPEPEPELVGRFRSQPAAAPTWPWGGSRRDSLSHW